MLDELLESESLALLSGVYENYRPIVKSTEDAIFGDVLGSMRERFVSVMVEWIKREPTEQEQQEFLETMDRRAEEIKSKILTTTSKQKHMILP